MNPNFSYWKKKVKVRSKSGCLDKCAPKPVFSYKLRYIAGFGLVEMAISTYPKLAIYRNLYEDTGHGNNWK